MHHDEFFFPQDPELRRLLYAIYDIEWERISPSEGEAMAREILGDTDLAQEPEASDPDWAERVRDDVANLRDLISYVRDESWYEDEQKESLILLLQASIAMTLTRGTGLLPHGSELAFARIGVIWGRVSLAQAKAIALLARAATEIARDPARSF